MKDKIGQLVKDHANGNVSEFSRQSGVPYGTLYDIVTGDTDIEKVSIGHFMKIARCLGMTADELYYGTSPEPPTYTDPRQAALNGHYESLNDESKGDLVKFAKSFASDPERRIEKERQDTGNQVAMGA